VRLELLDPAGTRRLLRDLPRQGESCATLSQAIALVVERYFRELEPTAAVTPAPGRSAEPTSVRALPILPSASADPLAPRLAVGIGLGLASAQPGAVAGAQVGYWLAPEVHLELALLADLGAHTEQLGRARLELRSYPAELSVGIGQRGRAWDFFAGPEVRWTLETASGSDLTGLDSSPGAAFSAGAAGGLAWWPGRVVGLAGRASLDYALARTAFHVETGTGLVEVLKLPSLQGLLTLGVIFGSRP
jgi:hypothetical protein